MSSNASNSLMVRISEGLVSWLAYQQVARRSAIYYESFTYPPVFEMASSRGWRVFPQKSIPKPEKKDGPPKTIDFLFARKPGITDENHGRYRIQRDPADDPCDPWHKVKVHTSLAALEIKFIRPNRTFTGEVISDIHKLLSVDPEKLELSDYGRLDRYLMMVGQNKDIIATCGLKNKEQKNRIYEKMKYIQTGGNKYVKGWLKTDPGNEGWRFNVFLLREQKWWKELKEIAVTKKDINKKISAEADEINSSSALRNNDD